MSPYRQIDGVATGSPLGPTLANLFLAHLEKNWFSETRTGLPCTYLRYMDDIFCVFDNAKYDHTSFLEFLNRQHPNLSFTCELGPSSLPFLDLNVEIENGTPVFFLFSGNPPTQVYYWIFRLCALCHGRRVWFSVLLSVRYFCAQSGNWSTWKFKTFDVSLQITATRFHSLMELPRKLSLTSSHIARSPQLTTRLCILYVSHILEIYLTLFSNVFEDYVIAIMWMLVLCFAHTRFHSISPWNPVFPMHLGHVSCISILARVTRSIPI